MSLILWLPLLGNINNQGLDSGYTFTNSASSYITSNNDGKIGKCFNFNSSATNSGIYSDDKGFMDKYINNKSWSLCAWVNTSSSDTCVLSLSYGLRIYAGTATYVSLYNSSRTISCDSGVATNDGKWHHLTATYDVSTNNIRFYIDGILKKTTAYTSGYTYASSWTNGLFIGKDPNNSVVNDHYLFRGKMNDVRVYNNALSPKEVYQIAKGLTIHVPLNANNNQIMNNVFSYPTFNTSSSGGGWNHWGGTGHKGSYGQNTDKQFIFRKELTYSHWVQNDSGATYNYLCYQSPEYEGGFRSLVCILKESTGREITESIVYPTWNANASGGATLNKWTSVKSIGDGFYLCKCEGFKQDGSNDLVGLYVCAGYRVYISECYMENFRTVSSDMFYSSNIVEDRSGFGYNGTCLDLECQYDSKKYDISTIFNGSSSRVYIPNVLIGNEWTQSIWFKNADLTKGWEPVIILNNTGGDADIQLGFYTYQSGSRLQSSANGKYNSNISLPHDTNWHHYCCTYDGSSMKTYMDGTLSNTTTITDALLQRSNLTIGARCSGASGSSFNLWFKGSLSDFRLYSTVLSADDVKLLYNGSASIANNGTMLAYLFNEA